MMFLSKFILVTLLTTGTLCVSAQAAPKVIPPTNEYYTINEINSESVYSLPPPARFNAFFPEMNFEEFVEAAKSSVMNLLKWTLHSELRPLPEENYIRKLHFGRWINDPNDNRCMNTRARVLVRDSEDEVTFRNNKNCVVDTGRWSDPYSGNEYTVARDIQVDHMIPLKHAYVSGAWKWDYKTRCLFANYMGYRNHLVPSSIRENTSKGDRGPDKYLPSNERYQCEYVKDWLAIKLIWRLSLTTEEIQAIQALVDSKDCKLSDFNVTDKDLKAQRNYITENIESCMTNKR